MTNHSRAFLSRRDLLRQAAIAGAVGAGMAAGFPAGTGIAAENKKLKKMTVAWNSGAVCGAAFAVAQEQGIFEKHGLEVEYTNFAGSTESLLESLATGKAEAAMGMALRWMKPLEQGFDVSIAAGLHAGCMRLLAPEGAGFKSIADLKGKTIAVADLGSPARHFFAIMMAKQGMDPEKDVDWRVYPGELLGPVVDRGDAQAVAHWDPLTAIFLKSGKYVEIASNMDGEYAKRACCVLGIRNTLLEEDPEGAAALIRATIEAQKFTNEHVEQAAKDYAPNSPKFAVEDLVTQLKSHGHGHSPVNAELEKELALYTEELKMIGIMRDRTDPAKFAKKITAPIAL